MTTVTRHLCPFDDCDWHHDEPDFSADGFAGITPDPSATTLQDANTSIVEQIVGRRLRATESVIRAHFESHPLEQWVAALVAARRERDQLAEELRAERSMEA